LCLLGWSELCLSICGNSQALCSSVAAPEFVFEHGYQTYLPTESTDDQTATVIALPTKTRTKKPTAPPAQKKLGCCYPGKGGATHRMCRKGVLLRTSFNGGETEGQPHRPSRPRIHYLALVGSELMIVLHGFQVSESEPACLVCVTILLFFSDRL